MNYSKTMFIATILLSLNLTFGAEYPAYTQEQPVNLEEQVNAAESTSIASSAMQEAIIEKTDQQRWNDHLTALAENDDYWDVATNIPTNSWKETALTLAKKLLDKDKNVGETLKTEFLNAVTTKVEQKEGTLAPAYTFIKEFDKAIDAY